LARCRVDGHSAIAHDVCHGAVVKHSTIVGHGAAVCKETSDYLACLYEDGQLQNEVASIEVDSIEADPNEIAPNEVDPIMLVGTMELSGLSMYLD
jgi:hypothetical protein